jgi:hypothetical protein
MISMTNQMENEKNKETYLKQREKSEVFTQTGL